MVDGNGARPSCQTCRFWARGTIYEQEPYGPIPRRTQWSEVQTGEYKHQSGECRIVAPYRCGGYFPVTFEFQGCGEHQPQEAQSDD